MCHNNDCRCRLQTTAFHWTRALSTSPKRVIPVSVMCILLYTHNISNGHSVRCRFRTTFTLVLFEFFEPFYYCLELLLFAFSNAHSSTRRLRPLWVVNVFIFHCINSILILCPNQLNQWIQYPLSFDLNRTRWIKKFHDQAVVALLRLLHRWQLPVKYKRLNWRLQSFRRRPIVMC